MGSEIYEWRDIRELRIFELHVIAMDGAYLHTAYKIFYIFTKIAITTIIFALENYI